MRSFVIFLIIAVAFSKSVTVTNTTNIVPTQLTTGEKCVGDVPQTEIERIQKRITALEARIEQFQKVEIEVEEMFKSVKEEEKKNLNKKDKEVLLNTKINLYLKRVKIVKMVIKLLKMIEKTAQILPKNISNEMINKLQITDRINRSLKIMNTLKLQAQSDKKMLVFETKKATRLSNKIKRNPKEIERIVTELVVQELANHQRKVSLKKTASKIAKKAADSQEKHMKKIAKKVLAKL